MTSDSSPWLRPSAPPLHWWRGESGKQYWFSVYHQTAIPDFDGIVYLLTRARYDGLFDLLYCGQSSNGGIRLSNHEKVKPALQQGMTHIHVHFVEDSAERFRIETDIRRIHKPLLNEQSVPTYNALTGVLAGALSPPPPALSPPPPALGNAFYDGGLAALTAAKAGGDRRGRGLGALDYLAPSPFLQPSNALADALNALGQSRGGR